MIIDSFTFFNEIDMLAFRLAALDAHVDKFLIVEADHTFAGKPKESAYLANKSLFKAYEHKIIHSILAVDIKQLDLLERPTKYEPENDFWKIEYAQRNHIADTLVKEKIPRWAFVLCGDLDEIPNPSVLDDLRQNWKKKLSVLRKPYHLRMETFYYNAKHIREERISCASLSSCHSIIRRTPQKLRHRQRVARIIDNGGWHFSYFMPPEKIVEKIESFSHQELNTPENRDSLHIEQCIQSGADLFSRDIGSQPTDPAIFPTKIRALLQAHGWL